MFILKLHITPPMNLAKSSFSKHFRHFSRGGVPLYILISLSGKLNEDFIKEFYKGANAICDNYNVKIIGGDLVGGDKISISIVILGNGFNRNLSSLKNAKTGDNVYIKGFHGNSAKGLELLLKGEKTKTTNL